jgi:phosphinothricin acetyltransferase
VGAICAEQEASLKLHQALGFVEVGRLREVGCKFDRWLDLVYVQRLLAPGQ